jgi:hypothetical protein
MLERIDVQARREPIEGKREAGRILNGVLTDLDIAKSRQARVAAVAVLSAVHAVDAAPMAMDGGD